MINKIRRNEVLNSIYQKLGQQNLRYVCIGSPLYDNEIAEGDIDVIVHPRDIDATYKIIERTLAETNDVIFIPCLAPSTAKLPAKKYLVGLRCVEGPILQLDIAVSYHWRGLEYFTYHSAQKMSEKIDGIVQLNFSTSSLIGAFKDMIYKQPLKQKRIDGGYSKDSLLHLLAEQGFSQDESVKFFSAYQSKQGVSWRFICLWFSSYGFTRFYGFLNYIITVFKLYGPFSRREIAIAFYGPDGAGKSSIINQLIDSPLTKELFDNVIVKHTRPHILPPISWYLKPFSSSEERLKGKPARSVAELGKLKSVVFVAYYSLDYLLGRITSCREYFRRSKRLVIFDRYAFEFGYQQTFRRLPKFMLRWTSLFYKKPLLSVFVYAEPEVIKQRKNELEISEIEYQVKKYQEVDTQHKLGSYFLDTSDRTIIEGAGLLTAELLRRMN